MKKLHYLIILLLFFSCSNSTKTNKKSELPAEIEIDNTGKTSVDSGTILLDEQSLGSEEYVEDECIFDQATQTDDFLVGIKEFENYSWDSISKTATIILDNSDTIFVSRGGCDSFGVSAELVLYNNTIDFSDWTNVNQKILWISDVLSSEFAYEEIKNQIDSSKQIIDNDYGYFSSEFLQDNNYEFGRRIEKDKVVISLSYYVN